jgi:hypothetical protein
MKKLFKVLAVLASFAAVLLAAAFILFDPIMGALMRWRVRTETGMRTEVGRVEVGLLRPTLRVENLVLFNTPEFGGEPFLILPELYLEYDREAAQAGHVHLKIVRLNIAEVQVVENAQGRTNIFALQEALEAMGGRQWTNFDFTGIDQLSLSFGRIKSTSFKPGGRSLDVNLGIQNATVSNVRSEQDLAPLMLQAVLRAGMQLLGGGSLEAEAEPMPAPRPADAPPSPAPP